ncbi:MAG: PKD domain-containing protein [Candidatus Thermoplasmatota archaeon]
MYKKISLLVFVLIGLSFLNLDCEGKVNLPPKADAGEEKTGYVNQPIYFDGSNSSDPNGDLLTYSWDFDIKNGIQEEATGAKVSHTYGQAGRYIVTLTVSDGFFTDKDETNVTVLSSNNSAPNAVISSPKNGDRYTVGEVVYFDGSNSSDADNDKLYFSWDFGDGNKSTGEKTTHVYKMPDVYVITLNVTDGKDFDTANVVIIVGVKPSAEVNHAPSAKIEYEPEKPAANGTVRFCAIASDPDGNNIFYKWDFDISDGINPAMPDSELQCPLYIYNQSGNYTVTLIVSDDGLPTRRNATFTFVNVTNETNILPVANAGEDKDVVVGEEVRFYGQGKDADGWIIRYDWDFDGDGIYDWSNASTGTTTHVYTKKGIYNATLMVTDNKGGIGIDSAKVNVRPVQNKKPKADAGEDKTGYDGQTIYFNGKGTDEDGFIVSYKWDFEGDGVFDSEGQSVSHKYTTTGVYSAILRVYDDANDYAEDTATVTINLNSPPIAIAGDDIFAAPNEAIQFDGSYSYDPENMKISYSWDFDLSDGLTTDSTEQKPTYTYYKGGIYTVTLRVTDELGKVGEDTLQVTIAQIFGVEITSDSTKGIAKPLRSIVYTLRIFNTGNGIDSFQISLTGKNSIWGSLNIKNLTIESNKSGIVELTVTPPANALSGDKAIIDVTARSVGDQNVYATLKITTEVGQVYNLTINGPKVIEAIQGKIKRATIEVTNLGNGMDFVRLSVSTLENWFKFQTQTEIDMGRTVGITFEIKATKSGTYTVVLIAISMDNLTSASISLLLKVKAEKPICIPGFEYTAFFLAIIVLLRRYAFP